MLTLNTSGYAMNIYTQTPTFPMEPEQAGVALRDALRDGLIKYEMAAANERATRDALIATWRDVLYNANQSPILFDLIHASQQVIDSMDQFLNRAGGRRK
jgi:hypothetical protein